MRFYAYPISLIRWSYVYDFRQNTTKEAVARHTQADTRSQGAARRQADGKPDHEHALGQRAPHTSHPAEPCALTITPVFSPGGGGFPAGQREVMAALRRAGFLWYVPVKYGLEPAGVIHARHPAPHPLPRCRNPGACG